VVYVNNGPASGCSDVDGRSGTTVTQPFCSPMQAFLSASTNQRSHIRVIPGDPYDGMPTTPIQSGRYVFIGSPVQSRGQTKPAVIKSRGTAFSAIESGDLTIDELDIRAILSAVPLLSCTGISNLPSLTVLNSSIRSASADGDTASSSINIVNCNLRLVGNIIGMSSKQDTLNPALPSESVGISLLSTTLASTTVIENNLIAGMWGPAADFFGATNTQFTFRFNTIVGNGRSVKNPMWGGIACPSKNVNLLQIIDSIIDSNSLTGPGGTQSVDLFSKCRYSNVVIGTKDSSSAAGLDHSDPQLDDSFTPTATSSSVVDKVAATAGLPKFDQRRTPRPQGSGWDIGAYELPVK
jgi:hypothetical protein